MPELDSRNSGASTGLGATKSTPGPRRIGRRVGWLIPVVALLLASPAPALDHAPPQVELFAGDRDQAGVLTQFCWSSLDPPDIEGICATYEGPPWVTFPKEVRLARGQELRIRIYKEIPPSVVRLRAWRKVDRITYRGKPFMDVPRGRAKEIETALEPTVSPTGVAWDVVFTLPKRGGSYYLELHGEWPEVEAPTCLDCQQWAEWYLHARVRGAS